MVQCIILKYCEQEQRYGLASVYKIYIITQCCVHVVNITVEVPYMYGAKSPGHFIYPMFDL